jgi:ribosomal protein S18 acetylase RimI-like enzyme
MLRDLRAADSPRLLELLQREFPEEERLLGTRPEGFERIFRRAFRWDTRLLLGLARAFGRPLFQFLVIEADGRLVGTTLVSFPPRAGYLSMVVVDPAYRRRGYAKRLLEGARATAARRGRPFVALDVLAENTPARTLYEAAGYRRLRSAAFLAHDRPAELVGPLPLPAAIRPFRRSDARPIAVIALRQMPPEVAAALPARPSQFAGHRFVSNLLGEETAAWVVDRGAGPEAHVAASVSPATEAAHLSAPVVGESVDPSLAATLVRSAAAWAAARHPPRLVAQVTEENRRGRTALEEVGFREALALLTLSRPVG